MPATFTVTANTPTAPLDSARQGKASFAVANTGAQGVRTRAYASIEGLGSDNWFALEGLSVRDLAAGATETYNVAINVPADAPPAAYSFRLSVVGVDNPDEEFAVSPPVTFSVSAAVVRPPVKKGYVEALAGALVGAFAGGALGAIPALLFSLTVGQPETFDDAVAACFQLVILAVCGGPLGVWVGSLVGIWGGLRYRNCEYPRLTALIMAIMLLLFLVLVAVILGVIDLDGVVADIFLIVLAALAVAGAAAASRALALYIMRREV